MKRLLIVLCAPLLLTGCLLSPGRFVSELHLLDNDRFAFTYEGEIEMLALSKLAKMAEGEEQVFEAECYDDEWDIRECTSAEVEDQRAQWDAEAEERRATARREAEEMRVLLGDIDPNDPAAADEIAARMQRQRGWERVSYLGEGLFDVEFAVEGTLTHDFVFPTLEGMLGATPFVSVNLREDGKVRVDAPGYFSRAKDNPMFGSASIAKMALAEADASGEAPRIVRPEGTFTLVTSGRILANNTDEGPAPHAQGNALEWTIGPATHQPPTALIAFDR
ncbi:MAG: hypothetical protein VXY04_12080 [Pseudomonadota bacterium]|jgi:hypothetical protein|uniref:Lipoprotein n=1 Tax=Qipengyuania flava TaxID=192812 RepID=A0A5P6NBA0_9SPHN|nr:hypothetical protein [Qipengyuania flava]MEC8715945.1 hypothetical protein [Pseudomonadota bacterium]QFI63301.1 hypothetical protein D0Y83_08480 [Qipengyuania flava]